MLEQGKFSIAAKDAAAQFKRDGVGCIICVSPQWETLGMWSPSPEYQAKVHAPKGKTRLIFYPICKDCFSKAAKNPALVEDKLLDSFSKLN